MRRFYIYAGTTEQAKHLAQNMSLAPMEWTYVIDMGSLAGLRNKTILCYGTCWEREDADDIIEMAKTREHKVLYIQ